MTCIVCIQSIKTAIHGRDTMNKNETREITKLQQYQAIGADVGMLARSLSALIRSARTNKSRDALMSYVTTFGVSGHPDFIV